MSKVLADGSVSTTELELVRQCQQGKGSSFQVLYQRYQQRVRATLYQLCGRELLDDLTQEVFLRAWKGLPRLREASYFSTWLYRICWNVASDRRRQAVLIKKQRQSWQDSVPRGEPYLQPELMQMHYQDLLARGLASLSLEQRTVLVFHDLQDLSQKQVAEILRIPLGTVKSRLFHARQKIRTFLEGQGVKL